jgi:hypothetical protein
MWSFFINVLSVPLVLTLFTVEFVYHSWRFRHLPRSKFVDILRVLSSERSGPAKKPAAS